MIQTGYEKYRTIDQLYRVVERNCWTPTVKDHLLLVVRIRLREVRIIEHILLELRLDGDKLHLSGFYPLLNFPSLKALY